MGWRRDLDSMQKRMLAAMNNKIPDICHDVTFVVGNDKVEISCHKIFLVVASPVFEAMFSQRHNHNSQETPITGLSGECKSIVIPDVHPDGLKSIIKYAYTGILNVDVKDATSTLYAADKYDIPELYKHCSEVLNSKLSLENVVTVYQAALLLNDENLGKDTWEFIEANAAALLKSEQFLEFSGDNLRKFLSLDSMPNLKSEVDVFKGLMRWGRLECDQRDIDTTEENVRSVLEPYLNLIRFPTMEADEFIEEVQNCGLLSLKECLQLCNYFILSGEKRVSIAATLQYPCNSRVDGKFVFCCAALNGTLKISHRTDTPWDQFTITGNDGTAIKLKSVGIVLPSNSTQSANQNVSIGLHDFSIEEWTHNATGTVSKSLEISYIEFDPPGSSLPDDEHVEVAKYSKELMKESPWSTASKQQLKLELMPEHYAIWALRFEN